MDADVVKRKNKFKYEIGHSVAKDFYYPEAFFKNNPEFIPSPWQSMSKSFKVRAHIETPLRKIKRMVWVGKAGY